MRRINGSALGSDLAHARGIADSGAGKLILPYLPVALLMRGCFPGTAQARGDCVSWGQTKAARTSICNEVFRGRPDEVTGIIEAAPEIPTAGLITNGIASAYAWWCRRSGGDGWSCSEAVRMLLRDGMLLCKPYQELNIDMTTYSYSLTSKYAVSGPPANILAEGRKHKLRSATELDSGESLRDFLYTYGCGVIDCGSQGYSSTRDANGVSKRSGSWSHSMDEEGYDDRPVVKQLYGEPLVLIQNSWGNWNSGPRDIIETEEFVKSLAPALRQQMIDADVLNPATNKLMIPKGSFWTPLSHCSSRYKVGLSGVEGWQAKTPTDNWVAI